MTRWNVYFYERSHESVQNSPSQTVVKNVLSLKLGVLVSLIHHFDTESKKKKRKKLKVEKKRSI